MGQAGLTEMYMTVDHSRQHVQAPAIDQFAGRCFAGQADGRDTAVLDCYIAHALAILVDDGAALEDQVVDFSHNCAVSSACS